MRTKRPMLWSLAFGTSSTELGEMQLRLRVDRHDLAQKAEEQAALQLRRKEG